MGVPRPTQSATVDPLPAGTQGRRGRRHRAHANSRAGVARGDTTEAGGPLQTKAQVMPRVQKCAAPSRGASSLGCEVRNSGTDNLEVEAERKERFVAVC
jgi:hypothetical protein